MIMPLWAGCQGIGCARAVGPQHACVVSWAIRAHDLCQVGSSLNLPQTWLHFQSMQLSWQVTGCALPREEVLLVLQSLKCAVLWLMEDCNSMSA